MSHCHRIDFEATHSYFSITYQYLDARAKAGAPAKANKELSLMSTICKYAVRWDVIEAMPFTDIMQNDIEKDVRTITRSQVVRFYLWSLRQTATFRNLGCAAMFTYLTGFRAAEVRPFHIDGKTKEGVLVTSAKRKKGQAEVMKLREWSTRLRVVVARAEQTHAVPRQFLFANSKGQAYTRSGVGSVWQDAMFEWIASFDAKAASALARKRATELEYFLAYKKGQKVAKYEADYRLSDHAQYFSLQAIRPAAITPSSISATLTLTTLQRMQTQAPRTSTMIAEKLKKPGPQNNSTCRWRMEFFTPFQTALTLKEQYPESSL